ncbi:MAG: substrate-binding domain-containing protein [Lachnospirales bacterium]
MKKMISFMLGLMLVAASLAGCSSDGNSSAQESYGSDSSAVEESSTAEESSTVEESSTADESSTATAGMTGAISVISREDGSGTRGAFIELMGIEQDDVDMTTEMAEITNSTSVMMTTVAGNKQAIGYVSLGSLDETQVKAVQVDGVAASADGVKDGSYSVSRPFNIATMGEATGLAADFINFVMSEQGQAIVEENGYISEGNTGAFESTMESGDLTIGGSSSIVPVMEKLIEGYEAVNANANIQLQQSDSTTGMNSVIDGSYDIGMASREVKDSELEAGLVSQVIALDGIAVIVNLENPINNLTSEQIMQIYTGAVTQWEELQ